MKSYQYERREGVHSVSWKEFGLMTERLAKTLAGYGVEAVVGVARGGLFPATAVACALRCEMFPARATRRVNDVVTYEQPQWKVPVSPEVAGRVVAVVDEIADTGETLALVAEQVRALGAVKVVTACLASHTWANPAPEVTVLVTDALVVWPWDRRVLVNGAWETHPELVAALEKQGKRL